MPHFGPKKSQMRYIEKQIILKNKFENVEFHSVEDIHNFFKNNNNKFSLRGDDDDCRNGGST